MHSDELREHAIASLVAERRRATLAGGLAVMSLALIVIWGATGAGYFWPAWPILAGLAAMALATLAQGWSNRSFAETTVRQRMAHLSGKAPAGIQR